LSSVGANKTSGVRALIEQKYNTSVIELIEIKMFKCVTSETDDLQLASFDTISTISKLFMNN
jgi:hypothetical protein